MASDPTKTFLNECKAQILKFSGPFDTFTEEAARDLDRYLTEEIVEVDKKRRTREQWSRAPAWKGPFFQRLALLGAYAKRAALDRMEESGEPTPALTSLHSEDLAGALKLVNPVSASPYCTPDDDG